MKYFSWSFTIGLELEINILEQYGWSPIITILIFMFVYALYACMQYKDGNTVCLFFCVVVVVVVFQY